MSAARTRAVASRDPAQRIGAPMTCREELIADALALLHAHGFTPQIQENGKHIKLKWVDFGRRYTLVISRTQQQPGPPTIARDAQALAAQCEPEREGTMTSG